jgi:hypothetical protein
MGIEAAIAPLAFCEDFPERARRHEAWWLGEPVDRPLFLASANTDPSRPIMRRMELLDRPEDWFEAKLADLCQLHRPGDMLPSIRPDLGPVLLGSLLGGDRVFEVDTAWTRSFIDDNWSNVEWCLREDNPWWQRMLALTALVSERAAGQFAVMSPGLGGSGETLLNLRGAPQLNLDIIDQPERIRAALAGIYPVWRRVFRELYQIAGTHGAWLIHWLNLWSSRPYLLAECDVAYMISRRAFETLFLPDLARQAGEVGRAVFHMDGAGATRQLDAVLSVPAIGAIQYSPGAGTPSALKWVEMFRKIQARGKALLVHCPAGEVLPLCDALHSEGLAVFVDSVLPAPDLDALFDALCRRYGTPLG